MWRSIAVRSLRDGHASVAGCLAAAVALTAVVVSAGCTPSARQDVSNAGSDLDHAVVKSARATDRAMDNADQKATAEAKVAGQELKSDAHAVGKELSNGAHNAVQGTEKVAAKTDVGLAHAGRDLSVDSKVLTLTPKVKMAILRDDSVKIPNLNVDTHAHSREVVVNGTAPDPAMRDRAMSDARQALTGRDSGYRLIDNIKVAGASK